MKYKCWQNAMQAELQTLKENHTWDIVSYPPTVKPIGSKWIFSLKLHSDRSLEWYKTRLIALGNKQQYGVDYKETFSLVTKMTMVRTILVIVASQSWQLHQINMKNAFLHGDLQEEIYMKLPSSMTTSSPHNVCKLRHLSRRPGLDLRSFAVHFFLLVLHKVSIILLFSSTHPRWA
jgi:hypothetical protein